MKIPPPPRALPDEIIDKSRSTHAFAVGFGVEMNMNSPENFAGGVLFNFDVNLATQFALGVNITGSTNFNDINVLEFSGMFRWYFLSLKHDGWFAQINAGYNYVDVEGAPMAFITELRGGIRIPMGNFYLEPYGRVGYPVVWGAGIVAGIRMPTIKRVKETKFDQNLTGEALAENIATILQEHGMTETVVEVTDEGIRISLQNIQFMPDSAVLYESERWKIVETANILRRIPNVKVQVSGHTAQAGTRDAMLRLSRERAENIASFLVVLNAIKPENITTVGYGADRPIASNATPEGMAANRRIEITILED
ncbi:MAG: OmpA family protein [Treponema sp.]|nr:OmpA family protein [Treponema sp.]